MGSKHAPILGASAPAALTTMRMDGAPKACPEMGGPYFLASLEPKLLRYIYLLASFKGTRWWWQVGCTSLSVLPGPWYPRRTASDHMVTPCGAGGSSSPSEPTKNPTKPHWPLVPLVEVLLTTWSLHLVLCALWSLGALEEPRKALWCFLALVPS